jgi:hypothetical protein
MVTTLQGMETWCTKAQGAATIHPVVPSIVDTAVDAPVETGIDPLQTNILIQYY